MEFEKIPAVLIDIHPGMDISGNLGKRIVVGEGDDIISEAL